MVCFAKQTQYKKPKEILMEKLYFCVSLAQSFH